MAAGLTFDPATRQLSGTPRTALPATLYTYSATDSDATGPDSASLTKYLSGVLMLFCMLLGVVLTGCADDAAWMKYRSQARLTAHRQLERELTTQKRTTDRLLTTYRECLAAGGTEGVCWDSLPLYRTCLATGGSDAACRGRP